MSGYSMDKRFIFGVCTGMAILGIITYLPNIAEALYSIPPTNAWQTIGIANDINMTNSTTSSISAISYRDTFYFLADDSIILNITTYP